MAMRLYVTSCQNKPLWDRNGAVHSLKLDFVEAISRWIQMDMNCPYIYLQ
jgi:hypothetical protein